MYDMQSHIVHNVTFPCPFWLMAMWQLAMRLALSSLQLS